MAERILWFVVGCFGAFIAAGFIASMIFAILAELGVRL